MKRLIRNKEFGEDLELGKEILKRLYKLLKVFAVGKEVDVKETKELVISELENLYNLFPAEEIVKTKDNISNSDYSQEKAEDFRAYAHNIINNLIHSLKNNYNLSLS